MLLTRKLKQINKFTLKNRNERERTTTKNKNRQTCGNEFIPSFQWFNTRGHVILT